MTGTRAPLHLGGPLGALGLGCVGGAVALAIAAINNDPPPPPGEAPAAAPALSVDIQSPAASDPDFGRDDVELAQVESVPVAPVERPARADGTEVQFIVRLKGAPEIDTITRNFKREPAAAQAAWQELVTRLPGLSAFTLAGASYSGEIKLAYQMPPGIPATPEEIRAVQDRLLKIEGVSYADPDYVAHPGKD
ncbi:hypothetical protein [Hyphomonas sp.]|jgi:hypothetical protein|uniref:hypothetical protein n=1 Tax=Hyphomonas sp. TaxID=87 RepID=UPI0025B7D57E|nr:hypothetical protein [Hyphomonas sp.]